MRSFSRILFLFVVIFSADAAFAQVAAPTLQLNADKRATQGQPAAPSNGVPSVAESSAPAPIENFETNAKQAILIDFNTDTVLYEKNSTEKMFPSSMTKVLTMYLVFDQLRKGHITMDTVYTISERSWKTGGSQMFLKVGDQVKVSDLIQGVTVQSGNDACIALAEGIGGSVEAFVDDMNSAAKQLGMNDTHFKNPDGLPTDDHYTTAKDLSIIARHIIVDYPEYYHYFSQKEFTYANITQQNRNKLLDMQDLGVDGMKTGFTDMGGYGMIATGVKDGRRVIAVINGLNSVKERTKAAADMIRYGYYNFRNINLFKKYDPIAKVKVWGGVRNDVTIASNVDVDVLVSRRDAGAQTYKTFVEYKEPWVAPIQKGTHLANLVVKDSSDKEIKEYPLYATDDVAAASALQKMVQKIKFLLHKY